MARRKNKYRRALQKGRRYIVYLLALFLRRILLCLPFTMSFKLCERLASLAFILLARQRKRIFLNLEYALGEETSETERRIIAKQVFKNAGRSLAEVVCWPKLGKEHLLSHVTIENPERILDAYAEGRGVIGLTAHLGNWEYLAAAMANILKIRFAVIARYLSNPWLNQILEKMRGSMGVEMIYRGKEGIAILRRLKKNHGLGILADQNIRGDAIIVNFFGKPVKTHKNLAELILRANAPVVPMFIIRNKDLTKHRLIVENSLVYSLTGNKETDLKIISETYTRAIESIIRRYPEQWMWMHNRWSIFKKHKM